MRVSNINFRTVGRRNELGSKYSGDKEMRQHKGKKVVTGKAE